MSKKQDKTALVWFRNDLRTQDQQSLLKACDGFKNVIAVYVFDERHFQDTIYGFKKTEKFRAQFLLETITELETSLKALNISIFIFKGLPEIHIATLVDQHQVSAIFLQKEWTSEEVAVTDALKLSLPAVEFCESYDQFLFHPDDIPYESVDRIPDVFTQFRKKCEKYSLVQQILPEAETMPVSNLKENTTKIPSLETLGFETFQMDSRTAFPFKGGENQALHRVNEYFWETKKLQVYKKTRNGLIGKNYSSKLSAWLANGSISARTIYWEVRRFEKEIVKNQDTYWLIFELIWRDYFKYISLKYGDQIFFLGGILHKEYQWYEKETNFKNWTQGTTAEPFVNANMKELLNTGWMSNRGRQNVASFWSKELQEDWRKGAAWFESLLIDYDVHSNWGNWMYNSGVGNDPRDRKFNIKRQADMYDAQGKFQNLWLQELLF
ncbi:DASH family cryptochrome [Ascidiimonas sp. W6]|uniref:DASH family cryptochrome n=1 Tax=Ascidiimonas meishanensis TaxID=3128903 RepID=UPI0030EE1C65